MGVDTPHVVLEMTDEPDCRFVAAWLIKAAEAQTLWSEALSDPSFEDRVQLLCAEDIPDLGARALEILSELEGRFPHVAALDLYSPEDKTALFPREFGMMVHLGFFIAAGPSYRMAVPRQITLEAVKQAAVNVLSTAADIGDGIDVLIPEHQLQTYPAGEAEAWRCTQMMMRRLEDPLTDEQASASTGFGD
jgi:hypothetical protein